MASLWSLPPGPYPRPPTRKMILMAILSLLTAATLISTATAETEPSRVQPENVVAFDPLEPLLDQLMVPVAAGVPPPPSTLSLGKEEWQAIQQKEQAYIQRLEQDRIQRQGSFYLELSPKELEHQKQRQHNQPQQQQQQAPLTAAGRARYANEPLPWDDVDENEVDEEYFISGLSPWGGEFRYEITDDQEDEDELKYMEKSPQKKKNRLATVRKVQQQQSLEALQVDEDDGSDVVDDLDLSRLELAENGKDASPEEVTRVLQMEESGEGSQGGQDPNVDDHIEEVVQAQVWNADGASQQGGQKSGSQEYVEIQEELSKDPTTEDATLRLERVTEDETTDRPVLDEIDLMGHEAEMDWLKEQDTLQRAWKIRHHHHLAKEAAEDGDEDGNEDEDEDEDSQDSNGLDEGEEPEHSPQKPMTPEQMFNDPKWHAKHGGLNPKHFHGSVSNKQTSSPPPLNRAEKNDRDEDGTVFPEKYSNQLYSKIVYPATPGNQDSALGYVAYNKQGDRIIDFSMVGWNEGNTDLPDPIRQVPVLERLAPRPGADSDLDKGDDTQRIQSALDRVGEATSSRVQENSVVPLGALVLARGVYRISKPLKIKSSGILFRGDPAGGSRIVCQWEPTGARYAIEVEGNKDKLLQDTRVPIVSDYTPVGSFFVALDPTYFQESGIAVGDKVVLTRIGNEQWVEDIGMDDFDSNRKGMKPWKKMRGRMYRVIRSLNPQTGIAQLDAPLPISIRRHYGGGYVTKYKNNKIRAIGIQFLDMVFPKNRGRTTDDMLDEKGRGSEDYRFSYEIFANYALRIDKVEQMYVSHVTTALFHNFVSVGQEVHHLTFDSVVHSYPDDMLSGQSAFQLSGQLVLIRNCLSQGSFHFFVDINHVMGPNVVHRSMATNVGKAGQAMPLDFAPGEIGPHMKFCTGLLFDQLVTDGSIQIVNRGSMGTGQGFSGANSVVWNSRAREGILTHRAKGFQNFVIGSEDLDAEDRQPWDGHGWKEHVGSEVLPGSLYLRQLSDRMERLGRGWVA